MQRKNGVTNYLIQYNPPGIIIPERDSSAAFTGGANDASPDAAVKNIELELSTVL